MQRQNCTPYQTAKYFFDFMKDFKESEREMAKHLGKSHGYVHNLVKCIKDLHPKIVEEWANSINRPEELRGVVSTDRLTANCRKMHSLKPSSLKRYKLCVEWMQMWQGKFMQPSMAEKVPRHNCLNRQKRRRVKNWLSSVRLSCHKSMRTEKTVCMPQGLVRLRCWIISSRAKRSEKSRRWWISSCL